MSTATLVTVVGFGLFFAPFPTLHRGKVGKDALKRVAGMQGWDRQMPEQLLCLKQLDKSQGPLCTWTFPMEYEGELSALDAPSLAYLENQRRLPGPAAQKCTMPSSPSFICWLWTKVQPCPCQAGSVIQDEAEPNQHCIFSEQHILVT